MRRRLPSSLPRHASRAFTVAELLIAVSLLTLIVFALYSMFNQTQKALRSNITQVDVLEAGRAALDLITRDVEQAVYSDVARATNLYITNWFSEIPTRIGRLDNTIATNCFQELFFLTRTNDFTWMANSYFVARADNSGTNVGAFGVGTLYRFSAPVHRFPGDPRRATNRLDLAMLKDTMALLNRVKRDPNYQTTTNAIYTRPMLNGVVNLRWTAYDKQGQLMNWWDNKSNDPDGQRFPQTLLRAEKTLPQWTACVFTNPIPDSFEAPPTYSNSLPAALELELVLLEPQVLERMKAIPDVGRARNFLTNQVGRMHVFRQRIPIRSVPR